LKGKQFFKVVRIEMWHFSKGVAGRIGPQTSAALDLAALGRLRKTV